MKSERLLTRWGLIVAGSCGPVLAGADPTGADYRTSTPLVALDLEERTALTASGRPYRLVGVSDPEYALRAFHALWNAGGVDVRAIEPIEAAALVAGNKRFDRTPEEQAAVDAVKLPQVARQVRLRMLAQGMDVVDAADVIGVEPERLRAFLDGRMNSWTVEEADAAFDTLCAAGRARGLA